ncbi:anthranilate phosphoribosyltransferase [Zafaria sp. Z1313]|uniref:anthranilate phosphoribosyltransferase n=1 Tax=unclassified Zafaria TaxID=2828765 RepID=UPI002E765BB9|nr:anthranilate phosphoribosyltransferase [Zafaria sp. J156]MEE1621180.1 anthranilate phosphoribosyltransferase [Zafaria sp. J156]
MSTIPAARKFPNWPSLLSTVIAGRDLETADAAWAMGEIMEGNASDAQIAGFLVALRSKGETVAELAGLVEAMLANARPLALPGDKLDIVGTGGDRHNTVNISSMAALVAAGAGARIVKHGNRAASSSSGSADVLEALGVRLDVPVEAMPGILEQAGIVFCFAQVFHPSMRYAAVPRRELGVATAFNFMGPLTNPSRPTASAIGCADARMAPLMAGVLAARGVRALVFRGDDGLDELTTTAPNRIWEVRGGHVSEQVLDATDLGLDRATLEDLRGGDAAHNAQVVRDVLGGRRGPVRDAVVLNAAGGLVALDADAGEPLAARLSRAAARAEESIDSGAAASVLDRWAGATQRA